MNLAIKTNTCWTSVIVDTDANQVRVAAADGGGWYYYNGVGEDSIRRAARDPHGASYRTLRDLRAGTDATVTRASHYDM